MCVCRTLFESEVRKCAYVEHYESKVRECAYVEHYESNVKRCANVHVERCLKVKCVCRTVYESEVKCANVRMSNTV